MKRFTICLLIVAFWVINHPISVSKNLTTNFSSTDVFERFYAWPDSLSTEAMEYQRDWLMHMHFDALYEVGDLLESEEVVDREDLDLLRQFLERHQQEDYYFLLAQSIAFYVCEPILLSPNGNDYSALVDVTQKTFTNIELEALSFSASLLVAHNNPTADLVAISLQALSGYWPDETIQRSARQTRAVTVAWLDTVTNPSAIPLFKQRYQSISHALTTLEELSGS